MRDAVDAVFNLFGIAGKFLAKRYRRCILGMGAANLDDVLPALRLVIEGIAQLLQGGQEGMVNFLSAGNVHGGGISVIGGLAHVHMVIGVDGFLGPHDTAQHFNGAV